MTKMMALVAAGVFAASSVFAGAGHCTTQASNEGKMACQVSMASLNLSPEQQTKMDAVKAEHEKAGCSEASEAKYMHEAKGILNKDQYAKFKAEMKNGDKDKSTT